MQSQSEPIPANIHPDTPIPVTRFVASLKGTEHEVFSQLVQRRHAHYVFTYDQWQKVIEDMKNEPVTPSTYQRVVKIRTRR